MTRTLAAGEALDRYFLEARARLLDVAAILDRIDRGGKLSDLRLDKIHEALAILRDAKGTRAERVQELFSLPYVSNWERPKPRR